MLVLHVINSLGPGGAEALLYQLVRRPSNIRNEVIVLGGRDRYSGPLEEHGVNVHHLEMGTLASFPLGLVRLSKLVRNSRADVVQTWMYRSNVLGGLFARLARIPVAWGVHCSSLGPLPLGSRLLARIGGVLAPWVPDFIINCSVRSAELHRCMGYGATPGAVIPNGYDETAFYPDESDRSRIRDEFRAPLETFLIGAIARWHPQKGIPILLEAVRIVHDSGVPLRCLLVGRGLDSSNSALSKLISDTGCANFVQAIGERSDVVRIARGLDLHVLSSIGSEAFPNVVAETMLSGTPNVVTDVGDSAMMVEDTGWIVPPGDPLQLAAAIEQAWHELKLHPDSWHRRRKSGRHRIVANFTLNRMAASYERVWRKLAQA
jgi:glycosyltransferase involved in cell wall biosynthesis